MEVGEEGVDLPELVGRVDEDVGLSSVRACSGFGACSKTLVTVVPMEILRPVVSLILPAAASEIS